jgi:negative regulator of sigma E activity
MSIDDELRRALKPVDPGPEFTSRVLAAVQAEDRESGADAVRAMSPAGWTASRPMSVASTSRGSWARRSWLWPAVAASLVGAVVGARWFEDRRETERGLQARTQVMQALRLTSNKLNVAREVIADHR